MNDKLAKFARQPIIQSNMYSGAHRSLVSVTKNGGDRGIYIMRISLHGRVVEKLGWQPGDRILLKLTDDGDIVLFRDRLFGRVLSTASGGKNTKRKFIRYRVTPEFYDAIPVGEGSDVEIDSGRIAFCLEQPKEQAK